MTAVRVTIFYCDIFLLPKKVPSARVPCPRPARVPVDGRPAAVPLHEGAAHGGVLHRHAGLEALLLRHVRARQELGPHQRVLTRGKDCNKPLTVMSETPDTVAV